MVYNKITKFHCVSPHFGFIANPNRSQMYQNCIIEIPMNIDHSTRVLLFFGIPFEVVGIKRALHPRVLCCFRLTNIQRVIIFVSIFVFSILIYSCAEYVD